MRFEWITPKVIGIFLKLVAIIVITVIIVELYNVTRYSQELIQIIRTTMEQSCDYFAIESFRGSSISKGNSYELKGLKNDTPYSVISGKFYENDEEMTYNKLYNSSQAKDYIDWLSSEIDHSIVDNNFAWKQFYDIMSKGDSSEYFDYYITPINLGFTYLDEETLTHIFAWKLANKLSSTGIATGRRSDYSQRNVILFDNIKNKWFIRWHGFRIYLGSDTNQFGDSIHINVTPSTQCKLLHITDPDDGEEFATWTHITTTDYLTKNEITANDLRSFKIMYDIRWTIDIGYEGVLPLALMLNFINGKQNTQLLIGDKEILSFTNPVNMNLQASKTINSTLRGDRYNTQTWEQSITNNRNNGIGNNEADTSYNYFIPDDIDDTTDTNQSQIDGTLYKERRENTTLGLGQRLKYIVVH